MQMESRVEVYGTIARPILAHGAETHAETRRIQLMRTTKINTIRSILEKQRSNKVRNEDISLQCDISDIDEFIKNRKKEWNNLVDRANENRLIKRARDLETAKEAQPRPPKRRVDS